MPQEKESLRRKQARVAEQAIYKAGVALISKRGYDNVTVDDICSKAGVSKGTFYSYFKSKDEIVLQQLLKLDDYYKGPVAREMATKQNALDKLMVYTVGAMTYISNEMGIANTKVALQSPIGPGKHFSPVVSEDRPLYTLLKEMVVEGQDRGELRKDLNSDEMTRMIIRAARGVVYDWCLSNGGFDLVAQGKKMTLLLCTGVRA